MFVSAALSLVLSSCGVYNKYENQTSVADDLYGNVATPYGATEGEMLGDVSWRELFSDDKLQALIEQALESNADLKIAKMRIEDAETSLMSSRLAYLPSLALAPTGSVSGNVEGGAAYKSYTLPLAASWDVDIFGELTNKKMLAATQLDQQRYATQATQIEIVAAVANLYYTISMLDAQREIAMATRDSWDESYRVAQSMMSAGMMNSAGLSQIEAGLYSVRMAVVNIESSLMKSQNALCGVLAIAPQMIECNELTDLVMPESINIGVPLSMLSSRPDVMAAESALAASFYSENIARSSFYPSITLTGVTGWSNEGVTLSNPATMIYNLVGELVQPIFTKGLNRAQLKIAKSQAEQSRITFEQKLLDAGVEVNDALTDLISSQQNSELYTNQVSALSEASRSTSLMMQHGSTTYLEVLTAQQSLFNAQLGQVTNRFDQMQSFIALYKSLGGGRF